MAEKAKAEAEDSRLDKKYEELKEKADKGYAGSPIDALNAAMDYLSPSNWDYFAVHDINFSLEADNLLHIAIKDGTPVISGMAAVHAAQMYRQPMHGIFDIDKSLNYSRYALSQLDNGNDLQKSRLIDACKEVVYAVCCTGEIK